MFHWTSSDPVDGVITASYTPSNGTTDVESSTSFAIEYTGVEGLTLGYAVGEENAEGGTNNNDNDTYTSSMHTVQLQLVTKSLKEITLLQLTMMSSKLWVLHTKLATI